MIALFVQRTSVAVAFGAVVGLAAAAAASRFLAPYLFETNPSDPLVYIGATALLAIAALTAAWLPAHIASRTNPAQVLRE